MDKMARYARDVSPFLRKNAGFMDSLANGLQTAGDYFKKNPNAFGYLWKVPGAYLVSRLFGARRRTAAGIAALAGLQNYLYGKDSEADWRRGFKFGDWLSGRAGAIKYKQEQKAFEKEQAGPDNLAKLKSQDEIQGAPQ